MSETDRLTKVETMMENLVSVNNANTVNISKLFDIVNRQNLEMATLKAATKQSQGFNSALLKVVVFLGGPVILGMLGLVGNTILNSYNNQQAANRPAQHGSP